MNGVDAATATTTTTETDGDHDIINDLQTKKSGSSKKKPGHDKREMDASSSDEIESEKNFDTACIESAKDVITNNSYITSATRSDIITSTYNDTYNEDIDINDGTSFIVGANATQLDEYDDNGYDNEDMDVEKQKIFKYYEDHDLSHLDNDLEVKSMLLSENESIAKNKMFLVCNPDWIKVKKDIDRRQMV
eukprot:UN06801